MTRNETLMLRLFRALDERDQQGLLDLARAWVVVMKATVPE